MTKRKPTIKVDVGALTKADIDKAKPVKLTLASGERVTLWVVQNA